MLRGNARRNSGGKIEQMAGSVARDLDHSTRLYFHVEILFGGEEPANVLVRTPASGAASGGNNSDGDSISRELEYMVLGVVL